MQHLRNLFALVALILRPRTKIPEHIRTVAVIQNMKLGDMVCTTPVFRALKKHIPGVRVVVYGTVDAELLAGHPAVDAYVRIDTHDALRRSLTDEVPDVVIIPGPNPSALATVALLEVPLVIAPIVTGGTSPYATRWYRFFTRYVLTRPHRFGHYAPREYLSLLEPLGIFTDDTKKTLCRDETSERRAVELLPRGARYVGIAPSAGNKIKQWPAERFGQIADELIENEGVIVVLIGSGADIEESQRMIAAMKNTSACINLIGAVPVSELKSVIARLDLFIASDTGPIYIAEAFGVPTVDIVGPVDEREQPPRGPRQRIVLPRGRKGPYLHVMNARIYDAQLVRAEVERTEVVDVLKEARALLHI